MKSANAFYYYSFLVDAIEAVRVSRLIDRRPSSPIDEVKLDISAVSDDFGNFQQLQQLAQLPVFTLSKNAGKMV
ncbi:unnamed protein product [Litomosoides sigmodontis]|uniref:Uncharacterized protein n=1 Tax=Litomosoides sigmodontis TaxID=42156 RepID=A0A3P6TWW3_LITSI|nr:unnamed protein product [Litomosoides sigmodontis]